MVVGLGPGGTELLSPLAREAIAGCPVVAGYKTYLDLIPDLLAGKEIICTGMTREVERCAQALARAAAGARVAIVSSGDPGVYGMAGLILEMAARDGLLEQVDIQVVPGITAATAAAARLGAPLMHDFAVISLSDLLTPWELIERRLEAAAAADFVVVLYNPASHRRREQIKIARQIMLRHKAPATPVGLVRNAYREDESCVVTDLQHLLEHPVDMLTIVFVGNSSTRVLGRYMVTPRGYQV